MSQRSFFFGAASAGNPALQQSVEDDLEGFEILQNALGMPTYKTFAELQAAIRPGLQDMRLFRVTVEVVDA
jgi:hypothetical protein